MRLEETFEQNVECFRSPLLQFSETIVAALAESGYKFDFSIPCWEPAHPSTLGGFGIELAQPFEIHGVVETPLTLFQDHQVLSVLGMTPNEALELWVEQANLVRSLGGDIVLLIHPDYAFSWELRKYKQLLAALLEIQHREEISEYITQ